MVAQCSQKAAAVIHDIDLLSIKLESDDSFDGITSIQE
jgi:hypothetical protein